MPLYRVDLGDGDRECEADCMSAALEQAMQRWAGPEEPDCLIIQLLGNETEE